MKTLKKYTNCFYVPNTKPLLRSGLIMDLGSPSEQQTILSHQKGHHTTLYGDSVDFLFNL